MDYQSYVPIEPVGSEQTLLLTNQVDGMCRISLQTPQVNIRPIARPRSFQRPNNRMRDLYPTPKVNRTRSLAKGRHR